MMCPVRVVCPRRLRADAPVSSTTTRRKKKDGPFHITCAQFSQTGEILATYNDEDLYLFAADHVSLAMAAGLYGPMSEPPPPLEPLNPEEVPEEENEEQEEGDAVVRGRGARGRRGGRRGRRGRGRRGSTRMDHDDDDDDDDGEIDGDHGAIRGASCGHKRRRMILEKAGENDDDGDGDDDSGGGGGLGDEIEEWDTVVQRYWGHRNLRTVKGCAFGGGDDKYVLSGSDCGRMFIWTKRTGECLAVRQGDDDVLNCLEEHPYQPLVLATSGIDHSIKIWGPTAELPINPGEMTEKIRRDNYHDRCQGPSRHAAGFINFLRMIGLSEEVLETLESQILQRSDPSETMTSSSEVDSDEENDEPDLEEAMLTYGIRESGGDFSTSSSTSLTSDEEGEHHQQLRRRRPRPRPRPRRRN